MVWRSLSVAVLPSDGCGRTTAFSVVRTAAPVDVFIGVHVVSYLSTERLRRGMARCEDS